MKTVVTPAPSFAFIWVVRLKVYWFVAVWVPHNAPPVTPAQLNAFGSRSRTVDEPVWPAERVTIALDATSRLLPVPVRPCAVA